jgi:hypothetical protein
LDAEREQIGAGRLSRIHSKIYIAKFRPVNFIDKNQHVPPGLDVACKVCRQKFEQIPLRGIPRELLSIRLDGGLLTSSAQSPNFSASSAIAFQTVENKKAHALHGLRFFGMLPVCD